MIHSVNGDKLPKVQLIVIFIMSFYFFIYGSWASAAYGGMISLINTALISMAIYKQRNKAINAEESVKMLVSNVFTRMFLVSFFFLVGLLLLDLNSYELILGLVFGLIGFLIDRII